MLRSPRLTFLLIGCALSVTVWADPSQDPPAHHNIFDFGKPTTQSTTQPATLPATLPTTQEAVTPVVPAPVDVPTAPVKPPETKVVAKPHEAKPPRVVSPVVIVKQPVPAASVIAEKSNIIKEVFGSDIADATTLEQKLQLSNRMVAAGDEEKTDMAAKYVIYHKAMELAEAGDDLESACRVVDLVDAYFLIDAAKLKTEAVIAIGKSSEADQQVFMQQAESLADTAQQVDQYDLAKLCMERAISAAQKSYDPDSIKSATDKLKQIKLIQIAFAQIKSSELLLQTKPKDPDANLKVGRFLCFFKGDWKTGLPMLAIGSDANLKALASLELQNNSEQARELADKWWTAAAKETGLARIQIRYHAGDIYDSIATGLSGLELTKANERMTVSAKEAGKRRPVNLLRMFNLDTDVVQGDWTFENGVLSCDAKLLPEVWFRYQPPEEYDYRIVFVRKNGNNGVAQLCYAAGHQFSWIVGQNDDKDCGIARVGGKGLEFGNPTFVEGTHWLTNGQEMTSVVKVRKTGVRAFLNGKLLLDWKTDYQNIQLRDDSKMPSNVAIGLNAWDSATDFKSVEVIEISGEGKKLQ